MNVQKYNFFNENVIFFMSQQGVLHDDEPYFFGS